MKLVRGFLMAWGCFCWIPCPYKRWHEEDRTAMVAMLPLVGTSLGLVTALVWALVGALTGALGGGGLLSGGLLSGSEPLHGGELPNGSALLSGGAMLGGLDLLGGMVVSGAVVTAAYFVMTGFIHLDGFMDVADAVMPRHPRLEERRRILKDPHTGSFAAVSMALMLLIFAACAVALSGNWAVGALAFIAVATTSRCVSAVSVICCAPMETSQYHTEEFEKGQGVAAAMPALVITVIVVAACAVVSMQEWVAELNFAIGPASAVSAVLTAAGVCAATELIIGALDRKALGGMNGDISGHMITSGEMAGMLAAAVVL